MKKLQEKIGLAVMTAVYLLCVTRYIPDQLLYSLKATGSHLLVAAPVAVGGTILIVSVLQRMGDGRLPWDRVLRIYLTFGIIFELFFGLYHYLAVNQAALTP